MLDSWILGCLGHAIVFECLMIWHEPIRDHACTIERLAPRLRSFKSYCGGNHAKRLNTQLGARFEDISDLSCSLEEDERCLLSLGL